MCPEIEPIHFDPATDGVKFSIFCDKGLSRAIKQQMESRQNVWEVGLWPDVETEKVARRCAEIFGEELGLPAAFVPEDSIWLLVKDYDDGVQFACEVIADEFGCEFDWPKLNARKLLTFGDLVEIAKAGKGKVIHPPPTKLQQCKSCLGCGWGCFMLMLIPLSGVILLICRIVTYCTEE